jgi:hypothetical protein
VRLIGSASTSPLSTLRRQESLPDGFFVLPVLTERIMLARAMRRYYFLPTGIIYNARSSFGDFSTT